MKYPIFLSQSLQTKLEEALYVLKNEITKMKNKKIHRTESESRVFSSDNLESQNTEILTSNKKDLFKSNTIQIDLPENVRLENKKIILLLTGPPGTAKSYSLNFMLRNLNLHSFIKRQDSSVLQKKPIVLIDTDSYKELYDLLEQNFRLFIVESRTITAIDSKYNVIALQFPCVSLACFKKTVQVIQTTTSKKFLREDAIKTDLLNPVDDSIYISENSNRIIRNINNQKQINLNHLFYLSTPNFYKYQHILNNPISFFHLLGKLFYSEMPSYSENELRKIINYVFENYWKFVEPFDQKRELDKSCKLNQFRELKENNLNLQRDDHFDTEKDFNPQKNCKIEKNCNVENILNPQKNFNIENISNPKNNSDKNKLEPYAYFSEQISSLSFLNNDNLILIFVNKRKNKKGFNQFNKPNESRRNLNHSWNERDLCE